MSELFICEWPFRLDFDGDHMEFDYGTAHPLAKADSVVVRKNYNEQGVLVQEMGHLIVRDHGNTAGMRHKTAIVVRRLNDLTPLPENCGRLIGAIQSHGGRWSFYVFDAKEGLPSQRSTSEETKSPELKKAADRPVDVGAGPSPSAGTTAASHSSATTPPDTDGWSGW